MENAAGQATMITMPNLNASPRTLNPKDVMHFTLLRVAFAVTLIWSIQSQAQVANTSPPSALSRVVTPQAQPADSPSTQTDVAARIRSGQFGVSDVHELLVQLQANLELAQPLLTQLTAGAGGIDPTTRLPNQLVAAAAQGSNPTAFGGIAGTNRVVLDAATYNTLVVLQQNVGQALLTLRSLNNAAPATSQNAGAPNRAGLLNRAAVIPPPGQQPAATPPAVIPAAPMQRRAPLSPTSTANPTAPQQLRINGP